MQCIFPHLYGALLEDAEYWLLIVPSEHDAFIVIESVERFPVLCIRAIL